MAKENHCALILRHMKKYGSITAKEAADEYGCMRLAARISDLRDRGVAIKSRPSPARTETARPSIMRCTLWWRKRNEHG